MVTKLITSLPGAWGWGAVTHLIRVTDYSYLAWSLSRKGSSKNGMRITIKMN